jgi:predicted XRE-type DNA-binding protein
MQDYTISSGNIFEDLGFPNAEEKLAKVKLASLIADIMDEKQLSQDAIANLLSLDGSEVTALQNGHLKRFSLEKLLSFLVALGQNVEISISPQPSPEVKGNLQVTTKV